MNKQQFDDFFAVHSKNVDNANNLGFWALTDQLLTHYLLENMPNRKNISLIDFGGGTGRWLQKLDPEFTDCQFTIVDLSDDMLEQAQKKLDAKQFQNQLQLVKSDICDISQLKDNGADYVMSTYNPLSFVDDPQKAINEAFRVLKPGGKALITVQGYHNALYSKVNNYLADATELLHIFKTKKVAWNPSVPELWQLPKEDVEAMFSKAGFENVFSRGIASITQPQGEDFDPENKQLGTLSKKLNEDKAFFDAVFEIEKAVGENQHAVDRAMNILIIGEKPQS